MSRFKTQFEGKLELLRRAIHGNANVFNEDQNLRLNTH